MEGKNPFRKWVLPKMAAGCGLGIGAALVFTLPPGMDRLYGNGFIFRACNTSDQRLWKASFWFPCMAANIEAMALI